MKIIWLFSEVGKVSNDIAFPKNFSVVTWCVVTESRFQKVVNSALEKIPAFCVCSGVLRAYCRLNLLWFKKRWRSSYYRLRRHYVVLTFIGIKC